MPFIHGDPLECEEVRCLVTNRMFRHSLYRDFPSLRMELKRHLVTCSWCEEWLYDLLLVPANVTRMKLAKTRSEVLSCQ